LTTAQWSSFRLRQLKKEKIEPFFNTIAQVTNARSIHSGFYKLKMMDDNQKKFIPPLAIDNKFFRSAFINFCTM
jgi:hypothetical protein